MFEQARTLSFFPSFVWVYDLKRADYEPLNDGIARRIDTMVAAAPGLTVGHSW